MKLDREPHFAYRYSKLTFGTVSGCDSLSRWHEVHATHEYLNIREEMGAIDE